MGLGFPGVGDVLNTIVNAIAKMIWSFSDAILRDAFTIIDAHSRPDLLYSPGGPLGAVYPITLWVGLITAFGLALAQAGRIALNGGQGVGAAAKGLGQYALTTAAGLGLINTLSIAADVLAIGIIKAAFNVDSFTGLAGDSSFMAGAVKGLTGWSLGGLSLLEVLPFGLGLIAEVLIRQGALLVLEAVYPIICAGLVHEKFARWYWTGLRWIMALIMMTPLIAIAMAIGHSIAQGVGTGHGGSVLDAIGQALVSGVICMLSLTAPLVLFKMFAFIDPSSASGQTARGWFGGDATAAGGSTSPAGAGQPAGSGSDDPFASDPVQAPAAGGGRWDAGRARGAQQGSAPPGVMGQVMAQLQHGFGEASGTSKDATNGAAGHATDTLDAVGAGHRGGPGGHDQGPDPQQDEHGSEQTGQDDDQVDSNDPTSPGGGTPGRPGQDPGPAGQGPQDPQLPSGPGGNQQGGQGPFEDDPAQPAGPAGSKPPGGGAGGSAPAGGAAGAAGGEGGAAVAAI